MPILHQQYSGQGVAPDGSTVTFSPQAALTAGGPWVQVTVGLADSISQQLAQVGLTIPTPIAGRALIDTGATETCIDDQTAQQLGLPVIDVAQMASASHASTATNVYPALIEFVGFRIRLNAERAMGANLAALGLVALIGRDMLQHCTLHYNGINGEITLAI